MKKNIHPVWHHDAVVTCSCGTSFTTGSTQKTIQVDICSQCHPFFTGEMRFVDQQGKVDKFLAKLEKAKQHKQNEQNKEQAQAAKQDTRSYQEILLDQKRALQKSKG